LDSTSLQAKINIDVSEKCFGFFFFFLVEKESKESNVTTADAFVGESIRPCAEFQ